MSMTIHCDIVSAEEEIFSGLVCLVVAAGTEGDLGIQMGHAPLLSGLKPGPVRVIRQNGEEEVVYVSGGYIEVTPKRVTILADTAVRAGDIDEAAALEAQQLAEQEINNKDADRDYSLAATRLAEAAAQLRTLRALRKKS